MHRFFLPPDILSNVTFDFPAETAHQISRVLRLREGAHVVALNGRGAEYEVELEAVAGGSVRGRVLERREALGEPAARLTLYLGLTQREKFEWMLQKCTEVGAAAFVPFVSSRSLVQDKDEAGRKLERWQKIVREAAEQSGRGRIPEVSAPLSYPQVLQQAAGQDVALIAWEQEHSLSLRSALAGKPISRLGLLIGPEGGFSEDEVQQARQAGLQAVTLGKRILRMETAAIVGAALALHELEGD